MGQLFAVCAGVNTYGGNRLGGGDVVAGGQQGRFIQLKGGGDILAGS
jgi:hypothetical protein